MITATIRESVQRDCFRTENMLGASFFGEHLVVVADYARALADTLGADPEIVELAAWFHDLSAVRDIRTLPEHAKVSADLAASILAEHGYARERTEGVVRCVLSHSVPMRIDAGSAEEVCLSNADAIAQIVRPAYWLLFAFQIRKLGFSEGRQWLRDRVEANWIALVEPAKQLAAREYELAKRALESVAQGKAAGA